MILLDTHVLIWAVDDSKRLSRRAVSEIRRARRGGGLAVSAISLWELASLFARGRIQAYGTIEASVRGRHGEANHVRNSRASRSVSRRFPRDPADRLISATARAEGLTLLTHDENIRGSPLLNTVW